MSSLHNTTWINLLRLPARLSSPPSASFWTFLLFCCRLTALNPITQTVCSCSHQTWTHSWCQHLNHLSALNNIQNSKRNNSLNEIKMFLWSFSLEMFRTIISEFSKEKRPEHVYLAGGKSSSGSFSSLKKSVQGSSKVWCDKGLHRKTHELIAFVIGLIMVFNIKFLEHQIHLFADKADQFIDLRIQSWSIFSWNLLFS